MAGGNGFQIALAVSIEDRKEETVTCYEVVIIGLTGRPFTSEAGVVFKPPKTAENDCRNAELVSGLGREK